MSTLFDQYSSQYEREIEKSIAGFGRGHEYYTRAKVDCLLAKLQRLYSDTHALRVLDVGCGIGQTDALLAPDLKELHGVDISEDSIRLAGQNNPGVHYQVYDGRILPYEDKSFDAAFMICVLHHVEPAFRVSLMGEVRRVVRPGGSVFIFEHNPFHPLTRLVVARCAFDRDAELLSRRAAVALMVQSGLSLHEAGDILYLPFKIPLLRLPDFWRRLPFGAQYYVAGMVD